MRQKCAITGSFERLRNTLQVPSFMRAEERPGNIDQFHSYPPNSSQACSVSSENSMPRTHKNCTIYLATFLSLYGLALHQTYLHLYLNLCYLGLRGFAWLLAFGFCLVWSYNQQWELRGIEDMFGHT